MGRRVKDYWTFINEESFFKDSKFGKTITTVLDPNSKRRVRKKSKSEIEQSKSKEGENWEADSRYAFDEKEGGYVGWSKFHFGKVVLTEIDDEGVGTTYVYNVLSGLNKGMKGDYEWQAGNVGIPTYSAPDGKKWNDLLGPDEEFFKNFKFGDLPLIEDSLPTEIVKIGDKGECEIKYTDIYQLYGGIRIYYNPDSKSNFSYEVLDGPNKGKKGNNFKITSGNEELGIYKPFSNGELLEDVVKFPPIPSSTSTSVSSTESLADDPCTGFSSNQRIYLDTSEDDTINPPTPKDFLEIYNENFVKGEIKEYTESSITGADSSSSLSSVGLASLRWSKIGNVGPILGKVKKSELPGDKKVWVNSNSGSTKYLTLSQFPKIANSSVNECYVAYYLGNPLLLYTVKCVKKNSPSLDWSKEEGIYGNNFFVGMIYNKDTNVWEGAKGEWYFDYDKDSQLENGKGGIGIIYAYRSNKKEIEDIVNFERDIAPAAKAQPKKKTPLPKDINVIGGDTFDSQGKVIRFGGPKY
jgi:hypothetical protein